jgi:4-hydroxybenzoyl-CoA reductase subunit beta
MKLPDFEYVKPASLGEATEELTRRKGAKVLAGGTDLLVNMKWRTVIPSALVNLKTVPGLNEIETENGEIRIGALVKLNRISESPLFKGGLALLRQAASRVGSYHHQVMGTLGGNLCQQNRCNYFNQSAWWRSLRGPCLKTGGERCHVTGKGGTCYACYQGDLAPVLISLDAEAQIAGPKGLRWLSVDDLFTGDGISPLALAPNEVLTRVRIPAGLQDDLSVYHKYSDRGAIDFPVVGVAVRMASSTGTYRIALTGVDRKPVRPVEAEDFLKGAVAEGKRFDEVLNILLRYVKPVKNSAFSPWYKRHVTAQLFSRAIKDMHGGETGQFPA